MREINQDERNLDLLAVFHFVLGGLTIFFSCFLVIPMAIGGAFLSGAINSEMMVDFTPEIFGWLMIIIPAIFIVLAQTLGVLMIAAGVKLKKRSAYTFCFVVAAIECLLVPYGTILGVITIIFLSKDSVKEIFAAN